MRHAHRVGAGIPRRFRLAGLIAVCLLACVATASAQTLRVCTGHGDHDRWQMKTRSLDHFVWQRLTVAHLLAMPVPVGHRGAEDSIAPFENQVWHIGRAYAWLVKQSPDDCDLHLELSGEPRANAPRFIAEIPQVDREGQRHALERLGLTHLGSSPHRFTTPVAVSVTGLGFIDLDHACASDRTRGCQHGSALVATLVELHPAVLGPVE